MRGLIFGFGNMGQNHYERYKKLNADIAAVIENDPEKRKIAESLGLKTYATLEDYLQENNASSVDFVDICLPTNLHFDFIKLVMEKFANHPIPITVEKPLVRTLAEANELEILIKKYKSIVFVAEVEHYNSRIINFLKTVTVPAEVKVKRMVNKDYFLKGTNHWSLNPNLSGGPILDLMIHDFSILDSFFGKATLIDGRFKERKYDCISEATVYLQFDNFVAEVTGSWLSEDKIHPIILTIEVVEKDGSIKKLIVDDYTIRGSTYDTNDVFFVELKAFLEAAVKNQQPHQTDEYLRVVKLANQIIDLANSKLKELKDLIRYNLFNALDKKLDEHAIASLPVSFSPNKP